VTPPVELAGVSVVAAGALNPAIFNPLWFAEKDLMPRNAVEGALDKDFVAVQQLMSFTADWLSVQVTLEQATFGTVDVGRELDLRDVVKGVFDLLPETPVNAVGLNADAHFRVGSDEEWHALGDRFLPKDLWQPLFEGDQWRRRKDGQTVGLRSMTVEAHRETFPGFVRTEVAPSVRLTPLGVYIGINSHFQLTSAEQRGNGYKVVTVIEEHWDQTRSLERELIGRILEIA
jgi:hypothetical protein